MDSTTSSIESEYIKNLQQQIYFLELEASFLRRQTKKTTDLQPLIVSETKHVFKKIQELQTQADGLHLELKQKESSLNMLQADRERINNHINVANERHSKEKQALVEEIIELKKRKEQTYRETSDKEMEILHAKQELEQQETNLSNSEQKVLAIQSKLKQRSEQQKAVEVRLSEKRMELLKLQTAVREMEDKIFKKTAVIQDQITCNIRGEISFLHQQVRERELLAEQDRFLRNKMMGDYASLTKENTMLRSQLLELKKQLDIERALREESYTSHSSSITQLLTMKEHEEDLQHKIKRHQELLMQEKNNFQDLMKKIRILEKERTSLDLSIATMNSRTAELKGMLAKEEQDNIELQRDKALLIDLVSNLQNQFTFSSLQLVGRDSKLSQASNMMLELDENISALKRKHELHQSLQSEKWQEISKMASSMRKLTKSMTNVAEIMGKY
ncbi:PREDICTED: kinesin-like protein KIF15 isoform X1 [Gavialis gangeticus]|uniref:kinesin-like protein KIF15 isoform X1 n=1 Tax=Gavialis gangeticus TaxID=94835 RepID=UPI00092E7142|nr:PREDICTED: kinesin-like protein KIF15 isoform X1 [Gavialis gangeticus]